MEFQFPRKSLPAVGQQNPVGLADRSRHPTPPQCRRHHSGHPTPNPQCCCRGESGPSTKPFYLGIGLGGIPSHVECPNPEVV
nr:hypothetical protein Itr_chr10CG13180 [Ipomoea trifida]